MSKISIEQVKKLRKETQAPVMEVRRALEEAGGDEEAAKKIIREKVLVRAEKGKEREAGSGKIFSYTHTDGKVGVLLRLGSETDFVARTKDFKELGKELTLQVASMDPKDVPELLGQDYIRDPSKTVSDLVGEVAGTVGENVKIERFERYVI